MTERLTAYVTGALDAACANIRNAQESTRNITLNTEAFNVGQLVGAGAVPKKDAESYLLTAALSVNLDRAEALRTIQSGLMDGLRSPRDLAGVTDAPPALPNQGTIVAETARKTDYAKRIYKESYPLAGSLAERYLRETRSLKGDFPSGLRYHPGLYNPKLGVNSPALIAPIVHTDATGYIVSAVHVTQIDPHTLRKVASTDAKKMFGNCKGGAVWLGGYARHMLVAEGIEKALACQHATGIPAAAGLSSTLMPAITWPRGCSRVTICADPNAAGEVGVTKSAANYTAADIDVYVCYPPEPNKDWDECSPDSIREAIDDARRWAPTVINRRRTNKERAEILKEIASTRMPEFERNDKGRVAPNEFNSLMALKAAGISIAYNEFSAQYHINGLEGGYDVLTDAAIDDIFLLFEREFDLYCRWNDLRRVVRAEGRRNSFHPVRDYLAKLKWDGVDRIDEWLCAYGGAPDTPFVRAVARIVLVAAVRRIRQPGCKYDEMLVLESPEGKNKSSALQILAGTDAFTDDAPINVGVREVIERLRGKWIIECADLKGMRKTEVEHLKSFLSRQIDVSTMKFEAETTHFRRQCIFIGTTNESDYLVSPTGSRRFWPVKIDCFDLAALTAGRDQLWAEAAHYEAKGESIRLPQELWGAALEEQERREENDEWDGIVATWLGQEIADLRNSSVPYRTTITDVATQALGMRPDFINSTIEKRVGRAMRRAGWTMTHRSGGKRYWQKNPEPTLL